MAYETQNSIRNRPGAVLAVIGIHALIGYGLVTGLAPGLITKVIDRNLPTVLVPLDPPPPPVTEPQIDEAAPIAPKMMAPTPPIDLSRTPNIDVIDVILPSIDDVILTPSMSGPSVGHGTGMTPKPSPRPAPKVTPTFTPIAVSPRNDPGSWITDRDYRSRWAREELTGVSQFRLSVGTSGQVTKCAITGSSGHSVLDQATCDLVSKRARFDPAKDNRGVETTGTYRGAVQWTLPE